MRLLNGSRRVTQAGARLAGCFRTDSRLLLRAFMWRLALPLLKHLVPLPTLVHVLCAKPLASTADASQRRGPRVESVRHLLAEGGRIVVSSNCLERSLMLYRFLTEAGAGPQLVMGVSKGDTGVAGHAWIEIDGQALADATTDRFAPILIFGAEGRARPVTS